MARLADLENRFRELERKTAGGKHLSPSFCAALAGALVLGLLGQGMGLFNKFSWHDDIFSLFMTGTAVPLGRWMLYVLAEIEKWFYGNGHFSLPLFNGMMALLCIGISAGLTAGHFRIRSRLLSALLGGIMAVFPAVTSMFGFMYTVHYYMIALLMVTAGGILICGDGPWFRKIPGILLCGCAVGIYQAVLPQLLTIVLLDLMMVLSLREEKLPLFWKRLLVRAVCVAAVMGVYFAGNRFFLWKTGMRLDGYLGIDQMSATPVSEYLTRAITAYREYFAPSAQTLWDMYPQSVIRVYRLMLLMDAGLGIGWMLRTWKKSPAKAALLGLCLALFPLGCNFIFVMSEEIHSLMVYGQVMQAALLLCLISWTEETSFPFRRILSLAAAAVLAVCGLLYIRYDNQCYLKTAFQQQEAISWNTTLVTRIESAEGFRDELPVAWVGRENMRDENLSSPMEFDFITLGTYDADIRTYVNDWAWDAFLARWCGFEPRTVDPASVADWPEVQAMPHYPDEGSIQVIRDTVVVNF